MISSLNRFAAGWWHWQTDMLAQVLVLVAFVLLVDRCIRRWAWPRLRHALWLLVLVKLVLPPGLTSPVSLAGQFRPRAKTEVQMPVAKPPVPVATQAVLPAASPVALPPPVEEKQTADPLSLLPATVNPVLPPAERLNWRVWMAGVWAMGALVLLLWLAFRLRQFRRELAAGVSIQPPPEWLGRVRDEAATLLGLRRVPEVQISRATASPAVFGLFRPLVLLPASEVHSLAEEEGRHILLHELAHVKRGDLVLHALYMGLLIAYWHNPLLWLARRFFQNLRELCCDATVANALRQDVPAYRETLLNTARRLLAQTPPAGLGLLGWFENSHWLGVRLHWLERNTWKRRWLQVSTTLCLVLAIVAGVLPMGRRALAEAKEEVVPEVVSEASPNSADEVLARYDACREKAPRRYVLAIPTDGGVSLVFRDGNRIREDYYVFGLRTDRASVTPEMKAADREQAGDTLPEILAWAEERIPFRLRMADGKESLACKSDGFGRLARTQRRKLKKEEGIQPLVMHTRSLRALCWPKPMLDTGSNLRVQLVRDDAYAQTNGYVCLEYALKPAPGNGLVVGAGQGSRNPWTVRHYLDPARNHVCRRIHELRSDYIRDIEGFLPADDGLFLPSEFSELGCRFQEPTGGRGKSSERVLYEFDPSFPDGVLDLDAVERRYEVVEPPKRAEVSSSGVLKALLRTPRAYVKGVVVAGDTGEPVAGALVRVAVPGTDMRRLRTGRFSVESKLLEARTDDAGRFLVSVEVKERTGVSVDALAPGFRCASGVFCAFDNSAVSDSVSRGQTLDVRIPLHRAKYVAGVVVDGEGKPLAGAEVSADLSRGKGGKHIMSLHTDAEGRFEVFGFPLEPSPAQRKTATLTFRHPEARPRVLEGVYQMDDKTLASLRVELDSGLVVHGTLLRADGAPAGLAKVVLASPKGAHLRQTTTDREGRFRFAGLAAGEYVIHAHGGSLRENCRRAISIKDREQDIAVRMQPHPVPEGLKTFAFLGMKLAKITPELRVAYDLPNWGDLLVVDPGREHARLGITRLRDGCMITHAAGRSVRDVPQLAARMLRVASPFGGDSAANPVTVSIWSGWCERERFALDLTAGDMAELKALCGTGSASLPPRETPARKVAAFGLDTPIKVAAESKGLKIGLVSFEDENGVAEARFGVQHPSHPKAVWYIHMTLLDGAGQELTTGTTMVENSGLVLGLPLVREKDLRLAFPMALAGKAKHFAITFTYVKGGVDKVLKADGIQPGMTVEELIRRKGRHFRVSIAQRAGSAALVYDDVTVGVRGWWAGGTGGTVRSIEKTLPHRMEHVGPIPYEDAMRPE